MCMCSIYQGLGTFNSWTLYFPSGSELTECHTYQTCSQVSLASEQPEDVLLHVLSFSQSEQRLVTCQCNKNT